MPKSPGRRAPAANIIIGSTTLYTVPNWARDVVHRPVAVVRKWTKRKKNKLPTTTPPSAEEGKRGQVQYIDGHVGEEGLKSFPPEADTPPKRGRPRNR